MAGDKRLIVAGIIGAAMTFGTSAAAQIKDLELPPDASEEGAPPPARKGIQVAARSGVALPIGMHAFDVQVPLMLDFGWKLGEHVLVGIYGGAALGGGGEDQRCGTEATCRSLSLRAGPQVIYSFRPSARLNPWAGLGAGIEWSSIQATANKEDPLARMMARPATSTVNLFGWDFARLALGLDVRAERDIGVGPFIEGAVGRYTSMKSQSGPFSGSGPGHATAHGWMMAGLRGVLMP